MDHYSTKQSVSPLCIGRLIPSFKRSPYHCLDLPQRGSELRNGNVGCSSKLSKLMRRKERGTDMNRSRKPFFFNTKEEDADDDCQADEFRIVSFDDAEENVPVPIGKDVQMEQNCNTWISALEEAENKSKRDDLLKQHLVCFLQAKIEKLQNIPMEQQCQDDLVADGLTHADDEMDSFEAFAEIQKYNHYGVRLPSDSGTDDSSTVSSKSQDFGSSSVILLWEKDRRKQPKLSLTTPKKKLPKRTATCCVDDFIHDDCCSTTTETTHCADETTPGKTPTCTAACVDDFIEEEDCSTTMTTTEFDDEDNLFWNQSRGIPREIICADSLDGIHSE